MRLITGLLLCIISTLMHAQIQDIEIDFSNGYELAYYNYINTALKIDSSERKNFWEKYESKSTDEKNIKKEIQKLKQSLLLSVNKSRKEVILIINEITELEIILKNNQRDFILDCMNILDEKRAIYYSIYNKNFRKKYKEYTSKN